MTQQLITCPTCKGFQQTVACWDCKGRGKRSIDDSTLRPMIDPLPGWTNSPFVFICGPCSDTKILVPVQITPKAFDIFQENKRLITCPRCGTARPRYKTKYGHATGSLWFSTINVTNDFFPTCQLWREPNKETDSDEFMSYNPG